MTFMKDTFDSPIGSLIITVNDDTLVGVQFGHLETPFTNQTTLRVKQALNRYFGLGDADVKLPMWMRGSAFQLKVYEQVVNIPFGETRTYEDIAEAVGSPFGARAVGNALSKNPLAIIIPCHRVIAKNGTLGGYMAGIEAKKWLLDFEKDNPNIGSQIQYSKQDGRKSANRL